MIWRAVALGEGGRRGREDYETPSPSIPAISNRRFRRWHRFPSRRLIDPWRAEVPRGRFANKPRSNAFRTECGLGGPRPSRSPIAFCYGPGLGGPRPSRHSVSPTWRAELRRGRFRARPTETISDRIRTRGTSSLQKPDRFSLRTRNRGTSSLQAFPNRHHPPARRNRDTLSRAITAGNNACSAACTLAVSDASVSPSSTRTTA